MTPPTPLHTATEIKPLLDFAGASRLAARFGLSDAVLDDPDAMVPISLLFDIIEAAVETSGDDYLGLHFGARIRRTEFAERLGAVGLLMLASPSVGVGIEHVIRYQRFFNDGDSYELVRLGTESELRMTPWGPPRPARIQFAEKAIVQVTEMLRQLGFEPRGAHLAHGERPGCAEVARVLGTQVVFGAPHTAVVIAAADLDRPIPGADPDVFRYLDRDLRGRTESDAPRGVGDVFTERTRSTIEREIHTGRLSADWLAEHLGCSKRTLQRRLAESGTSVSSLVSEVRKTRAQAMLARDMSVGDVAFLLGYSTSAPFARAFRRWFGVPPTEWRTRRAAQGPDSSR